MAGPNVQKRRREEMKRKASNPTSRKKIKRQQEYHSSSEDEGVPQGSNDANEQDFNAVNLLDSDDDIHAAHVDEAAQLSDTSDMSDDEEPLSGSEEELHDDDSPSDDSQSDEEVLEGSAPKQKKTSKSKRNDPTAFATSLSKILSTKLPSSRRNDPVLSRSTAAHQASKAAADAKLEARAIRKLREQKKQAKQKGRVRDVMVGQVDPTTGEPEKTISAILAEEKTLRKAATMGVVRMFNAIRSSQKGAEDAARDLAMHGTIGSKAKKTQVTEMTKEAFLNLIAKGGGKLTGKPLEEA